MSAILLKLIFVRCDECGTRISPPAQMAQTQRNAYAVAANHGWKKLKGEDVCPSCIECRIREAKERGR